MLTATNEKAHIKSGHVALGSVETNFIWNMYFAEKYETKIMSLNDDDITETKDFKKIFINKNIKSLTCLIRREKMLIVVKLHKSDVCDIL